MLNQGCPTQISWRAKNFFWNIRGPKLIYFYPFKGCFCQIKIKDKTKRVLANVDIIDQNHRHILFYYFDFADLGIRTKVRIPGLPRPKVRIVSHTLSESHFFSTDSEYTSNQIPSDIRYPYKYGYRGR